MYMRAKRDIKYAMNASCCCIVSHVLCDSNAPRMAQHGYFNFFLLSLRVSSCAIEERGRAQTHARTELRRMSTTAFAAVGRTRWKPRVALAADLLVTVVLGREDFERGFDDAATETVSLVV